MLQDKLQPKEAEDILQSVSEGKKGPRSKKSQGNQTQVHQLAKKVSSSSLKNKQIGTLRPKLELYRYIYIYIYIYINMCLLPLGLMCKRPF